MCVRELYEPSIRHQKPRGGGEGTEKGEKKKKNGVRGEVERATNFAGSIKFTGRMGKSKKKKRKREVSQ